jgi:hypothetical protein
LAVIQLEGIRAGHVGLYWPRVEPWITAAIHDAGHCWTIDDVRVALATDSNQLWVIWSGAEAEMAEMIGCIVTHVFQSPRGKTCAIPVVFCTDMDAAIATVLGTVEAWAKSLDCVRVQGEGRRGWERALKPLGWTTITTQVEKVI